MDTTHPVTAPLAITAATVAVFFALAAAGSSPPVWMWVLLLGFNAAALTLAVRRSRR